MSDKLNLAEPCDGERPIRWQLVARLRREIAAGTYDTPERLEAGVEKMLDRHGPEAGADEPAS